jgi:hypothetical protein
MKTNFKLNNEIPANQMANLKLLRDYIAQIKDTYSFNIRTYTDKGKYSCNTDCCLIGHAYHAGIGSLPLARPQVDFFYDFDFREFGTRELCNEYIDLTFDYLGEVISVTNSLYSFLFDSLNPNCFDQALARLEIVINQDWEKISVDDPYSDSTSINFSHEYPISGT